MEPVSTTNAENIRRLADVLNACSVGKVVTYDQFRRAIGFDVRQNRYFLEAAKRLANEETGAGFKPVRGVGYERLPHAEAHAVAGTGLRRIRRVANKATRVTTNMLRHANDISNDQARKAVQKLGALGLAKMATYEKHMPPVPEGVLPTDPSSIARESLERMREALGRTKG